MIENLQVAFGIDSNDDGLIAGTEYHDDLDGFDVSKLRQVRVSVITKTNSPDPERAGSGMPASENHTGAAADGYIRRKYSALVVPRNITGF